MQWCCRGILNSSGIVSFSFLIYSTSFNGSSTPGSACGFACRFNGRIASLKTETKNLTRPDKTKVNLWVDLNCSKIRDGR